MPSLEEQKILLNANSKLEKLNETISELKSELGINPHAAKTILEKFDIIHSPIEKLTKEDEILSIIRMGENKHVEFKSTLSTNIHTNKKR